MRLSQAARPSAPAPTRPSATGGKAMADRQAEDFDAWSALIAAALSPDDYVVIERDGELFIEPAPTRQ